MIDELISKWFKPYDDLEKEIKRILEPVDGRDKEMVYAKAVKMCLRTEKTLFKALDYQVKNYIKDYN